MKPDAHFRSIRRRYRRYLRITPQPRSHLANRIRRKFWTAALEAKRKAVNRWIRTSNAYDAIIDFDKLLGRLVTKDELIKEVWPDSFVEENNLAYHVFALRRALGETPEGGKYVETVPKRGYRFVAPVKVVNRADVVALAGSPLVAKSADTEQEKAVDLGSDESESRNRSSEAPDHGEPVGADTARDGQGASRFSSRSTTALWFAAGACGAAIVVVFVYQSRPPVAREQMKVEVSTEVRLTESSTFAISPNGRRLVFAGSGADGVVRLWVRSLDASDARPLAGTEVAGGGVVPPMFWSPDSRFVAFDAAGQLKKIEVAGGSPQTVCTLPSLAVGGSWNQATSSWSDALTVGSSAVLRRAVRRPSSQNRIGRNLSRRISFRGFSPTVVGSST